MTRVSSVARFWPIIALVVAVAPLRAHAGNLPIGPIAPAPRAGSSATWTWEALKTAEFDQRDAFTAQTRTMLAGFEPELAALRSRFKETDATESQKKAMVELDRADFDFAEKIKALDNVAPETWETVKSNLLSSWMNLQEAFKKTKPTE
jgi:hypothetical protein